MTVNISSPNTAGLRDLQESAALRALLTSLKRRQSELHAERGRYVPLAAKVAPDLDDASTDAVGARCCSTSASTAASRRTRRSRVRFRKTSIIATKRADSAVVRCTRSRVARVARLARSLDGRIPIIGVGGIHDVASARRFDRRGRRAGAGVHRLHLRRSRPGASGRARPRRLADRCTNQYAFGRVEGAGSVLVPFWIDQP